MCRIKLGFWLKFRKFFEKSENIIDESETPRIFSVSSKITLISLLHHYEPSYDNPGTQILKLHVFKKSSKKIFRNVAEGSRPSEPIRNNSNNVVSS